MANRQPRRPPGFRTHPECVVLEPRPGLARAARPPVRIFVGTEPGQHRAERVFVWSIEQVRDPSRTYEIHLMADLEGFDRRRWLTGFTNYRFAIPHLAGGSGRAIYNDVDQIYLADPAELFDLDMGAHGFLSITPRDTSVMLIDCGRMAAVWTPEMARRLRRKRIEARTRAAGDLWGPLAREWNARDGEYVAGRSKVLHFTTIHTQPWQPFPERFVYQHNPVGQVWVDMERAADRAGFQVFTARRPSAELAALGAAASAATAGAAPAADDLEALLREAVAERVLEVQLGDQGPWSVATGTGRSVRRLALADGGLADEPDAAVDAVVAAGVLDGAPDADVPWLLEELFRCARRCVYLAARADPLRVAADGSVHARRARPLAWWLARVEHASARHPEVRWRLVVRRGADHGEPPLVREGGRRLDGRPPTVWVLADHKAGHATQSLGLAAALGFPYEVKALRFNLLNHLSNRIRGASRLGLDRARSAPLRPPWPDLVISTGRRTAPVARWIGAQSGGRARLVQLGRRGGETVDAFDLVATCAHFRLPLHPRRVEIVAPLHSVTPERLAEAAARFPQLFAEAPRPHVVLVVGGTCARYRLDADIARHMAEQTAAFARSLGGSLFAITSPRTGVESTAALRAGLAGFGRLHEWKPGEVGNPYIAHLALADVLVVSGDSESMLAEAVAAAKPLFIYPLPERPLGFRLPAEWVARRAEARPRKAKGTVRPQQGLEHLCARLIEAGIVRPPRQLDRLYRGLVDAGAARLFGAPFDPDGCRPLRDVETVARRVRLLLGFADAATPAGPLRPLAPVESLAPPPRAAAASGVQVRLSAAQG
ncbi:mitochondrial fission ELM1 family protein [bacterium]|nr:mitochondrial fission ELM1 family protein [bacterium]